MGVAVDECLKRAGRAGGEQGRGLEGLHGGELEMSGGEEKVAGDGWKGNSTMTTARSKSRLYPMAETCKDRLPLLMLGSVKSPYPASRILVIWLRHHGEARLLDNLPSYPYDHSARHFLS